MAFTIRTLAPCLALACVLVAATPADAQEIILGSPPVVTYSSPVYQSAPIVTYSSPIYQSAPVVTYSSPAYAPVVTSSYYSPVVTSSYYSTAVPYYSYSVPATSRGVVVSSSYAPIAASSTTRYGLFGRPRTTSTSYYTYPSVYVYP